MKITGDVLAAYTLLLSVIGTTGSAVREHSWGAFQYYDPVAAAFVLVSLMTLYVGILQLIQVKGFIGSRIAIARRPPAVQKA